MCGSYWAVDRETSTLRFVLESGDAGPAFREVTLAASFAEGVGLSGRAWRQRDLVFVPDLGEISDCVRAPVAQEVGVRSGVCFPLVVGGDVIGTMDFFATSKLELSASRLEALRNVGLLTSAALSRIAEAEVQRQRSADVAAVNEVLEALTHARSVQEATTTALDTVRKVFGWAYGSFWSVDDGDEELRFANESGTAGDEFRQVTLAATFARGVGLSGRAWSTGDLVVVPDLGQMADCVRAPVAQRAGVRSGVCLPIRVGDRIVGTMDFFSLETLTLSPSRLQALRNVGRLVSQTLERIAEADRAADVVKELAGSIAEVDHQMRAAASITDNAVENADSAGRTVRRLGESGSQIGSVIDVISSIANTQISAIQAETVAAVEALAMVADIVRRISETQRAVSDALANQRALAETVTNVS